jgi:hypothetical protein
MRFLRVSLPFTLSLLVAFPPVRDLLFWAKDLFVRATVALPAGATMGDEIFSSPPASGTRPLTMGMVSAMSCRSPSGSLGIGRAEVHGRMPCHTRRATHDSFLRPRATQPAGGRKGYRWAQ